MIWTGQGSILFERAQPEGSPRISTPNYIQSISVKAGDRFDFTCQKPLACRRLRSLKLIQQPQKPEEEGM